MTVDRGTQMFSVPLLTTDLPRTTVTELAPLWGSAQKISLPPSLQLLLNEQISTLAQKSGVKKKVGGIHIIELNKNPVEGFSAGLIDDNDLYRWEVLIIGPPDTLYEGGVFKAHLTFPKDYPLRPPKMKFITEIWHPNVDKNGDVCISILHEPGEDKYGYEKPEERWLPIHTVETIMISVISMLADPNGDSPANVDAAVRRSHVFPSLSLVIKLEL
ncbi:PREDICTED: ubiquitin-conjugating enzyme E2 G1 [Colobus angolensis palliatus]|nr:PREDICTED: ubiquitin-conjugating enzyme E2 G1 [Colobus angolensis palliatus]